MGIQVLPAMGIQASGAATWTGRPCLKTGLPSTLPRWVRGEKVPSISLSHARGFRRFPPLESSRTFVCSSLSPVSPVRQQTTRPRHVPASAPREVGPLDCADTGLAGLFLTVLGR